MSNRALTPQEEAIKNVIVTHIRMISYDPDRPQACACGWTGTGKRKGSKLSDHVARQISKAIEKEERIEGPPCLAASPHTIEMHRAHKEPLCIPCGALLRAFVTL